MATADYGELVAIEADQVVTGEMAGCSPVEAIPVLFDVFAAKPLPAAYSAEMAGKREWKITVDVFRDLGLAFVAAMVMIYILLVGQSGLLAMSVYMLARFTSPPRR